jgi:hypothetical protein
MKRVIASLAEPRRIHEYVTYAKVVAESVAADPIFASPRPPIADVLAHVEALGEATVDSVWKEAGKKSARQAVAYQVHSDLMTLRGYVQQVADEHPGEEAVIIARAGMRVKNTRGPSKPGFEAKLLPVSGSVHLFARAPRSRASYDWQYSTDQERWLFGEPTVRADATLTGLTRGVRYFFRYRTVTKEGVSGWSQMVSQLMV